MTNPLQLLKKKKSNVGPQQEMEVEFAAEGVISALMLRCSERAGGRACGVPSNVMQGLKL